MKNALLIMLLNANLAQNGTELQLEMKVELNCTALHQRLLLAQLIHINVTVFKDWFNQKEH